MRKDEGGDDGNSGVVGTSLRVREMDNLLAPGSEPSDNRPIPGLCGDGDCLSDSAGVSDHDRGRPGAVRVGSPGDHARRALVAGGAALAEGLSLILGTAGGLLLYVVGLIPFVGDLLADALRVLGWGIRDTWRMLRTGDKERLFGLYVIVGLYGRGKTAFVVNECETIRKERGDKVRIYTNFGWKGEDGPIWGWRQMVEALDQDIPHVFCWDELGSSLNQHNYGKGQDAFPKDLFRLITQMRKGPGIRIYCTVQRFNNASVDLRRLAKYIIEVSGFARSRWIWAWAYDGYEAYNDGLPRLSPMGQKDLRVVAWTKRFVFTDYLRGRYDSYAIIPELLEMSDEEMQRRAGMDDQARSVFQAHEVSRGAGALALASATTRKGK